VCIVQTRILFFFFFFFGKGGMGRIDDVIGLLLKIQAEKRSWLFPCMFLDFVLCTLDPKIIRI
jgi:hypothetical protein